MSLSMFEHCEDLRQSCMPNPLSLSDCHFEFSVQEVSTSVQGKLMGIQQGGA